MLEIFALFTFLAVSGLVVGAIALVVLVLRGLFKLLGAPVGFVLMIVVGVPILVVVGVLMLVGLPVIGVVGVAIAIPLICIAALVCCTCSLVFGLC